ncbi:uncharacterized protein N7483_008654 [Penicillium malachiteum]|uniref:uncharacterized protein n=1 Tax=Penicillium malachiteum TaxID=1324776 RepID=UPI0025481838|nr:uncharacterized protein N7483_008654 [Penicillium malachiteum]KAJ5720720.1 hypothetical protein N7483_008654 [Penicillium malachiteum]
MGIQELEPPSTFKGTTYVDGEASGILMTSDLELSFWGGVSPQTSHVIDKHHPLSGQELKSRVLAIPGGRGSCTGSTVILELLLNRIAPAALIFERREEILTLGVIVSEEIFGIAIPVMTLNPSDFRQLVKLNGQTVQISNSQISTYHPGDGAAKIIHEIDSSKPEFSSSELNLTELDYAFLKNEHGDAARAAMRIVLRLARVMGATELMDVTQVHVDGCGYTGKGALAFAENLRDRGGKVRVPTTSNSISVDKNLQRVQGANEEFTDGATRLADAYTDMGARPTFTCAPYQLNTAPGLGEQIAWAESNAVVYANSVLGARTMKYPDFLDICIGLTGRAPKGGPHVEINRRATLIVEAPKVSTDNIDDSFYPLLGYHVGSVAVSEIPAVTGIKHLAPTKDDLKAFGAAFATVSGAPMFHIVGVTPEAPTLEAATGGAMAIRSVETKITDLIKCWNELNTAPKGQPVDLVSLGNPHFSLSEIRHLARLCKGRTKDPNVHVMVTCGRTTYASACRSKLTDDLEEFGVQFITDTCWCMITEPTIPQTTNATMTNSGKYAHYGPGLTGKSFYFGDLARCVDAACGANYAEARPCWLE